MAAGPSLPRDWLVAVGHGNRRPGCRVERRGLSTLDAEIVSATRQARQLCCRGLAETGGRLIVFHSRLRLSCGASFGRFRRTTLMAWTTPVLVEICVGLEINGYLAAEI